MRRLFVFKLDLMVREISKTAGAAVLERLECFQEKNRLGYFRRQIVAST